MTQEIDIAPIIDGLGAEFDALIEERQEIRVKTDDLKKRADEIDRKIAGIQQTLQGFSLYSLAQETPTELMKKTTVSLTETIDKMKNFESSFRVSGPSVPKTLSECCRDILRRKEDWMTAVEVRAALLAAGFDFSKYTSNPLSSIHTTLKRMVPTEVETDGTKYRWVGTVEIKLASNRV